MTGNRCSAPPAFVKRDTSASVESQSRPLKLLLSICHKTTCQRFSIFGRFGFRRRCIKMGCVGRRNGKRPTLGGSGTALNVLVSLIMRLLMPMTILVLAGGILAYGAAQKSAPQGGEAIYRQKCGGCHGLDGKSESIIGKTWKMRDLTSPEVQKQPDSVLIGTITQGRGYMPSYGPILGNERIQAVVAYLRELGKK